jgi:hypothetical protein
MGDIQKILKKKQIQHKIKLIRKDMKRKPKADPQFCITLFPVLWYETSSKEKYSEGSSADISFLMIDFWKVE